MKQYLTILCLTLCSCVGPGPRVKATYDFCYQVCGSNLKPLDDGQYEKCRLDCESKCIDVYREIREEYYP